MAAKSATKSKHSKFSFSPPSKAFVRNFMAPFKFYFAPQFYGIDELDVTKPAMYVSNHTVLGVLDGFPFGTELYLRKGIFLRALADSNHFKIPVWRDIVSNNLGAVEASRENCRGLMKEKQSIVVYPGGTREICKKKGEEYILKWTDRRGFVRMAMEFGYDIIPVAAVGAEEAFTIVEDSNDILNSAFGKFLKFIGVAEKYFKNGELMPPVVRGIGDTIIPRPAKLYFSFGKRISTKQYKAKFEDPETQELLKKKVEDALHKQFGELFKIRDNDRDRSKWRRLLNMKKPQITG
ncbi:MAG TPA: lysophospholipid acyltransferase family protein [Chitinophagales bacterium]|nr:lysophospholipid acyltransferase family protein [Chitinophagales bacterium]